MQITFFLLLLAFVAVALAIPAGKEQEKPKTKDNLPTKQEEEGNVNAASRQFHSAAEINAEKEDQFRTVDAKVGSSKGKEKESSEEENKESPKNDDENMSKHGSSKGKDRGSSEEGDEKSTEEDETDDSTSTKGKTLYTPPKNDEKRCRDLIGLYVHDKFVGLEVNHDLQMILEKHGGPPGKVNATWTEKEDAPVQAEDLEKRPLPDADKKYWIYKYGDSDAKTYIRIEHAVRRFSGTQKAFLEIRGEVYFTPDDFCGKSRRAIIYVVDDRGLTNEVTHQYCWIGSTVSCALPAYCKTDKDGHITSCAAGPSQALLATLIGGGK